MRMSLRHSFFIWWTNKVEYAILIEECDFLNYIQNDSIINKQFEFIEEENKIITIINTISIISVIYLFLEKIIIHILLIDDAQTLYKI